jgi:N-acyl-D-aspartate/D-glutamate deacylase
MKEVGLGIIEIVSDFDPLEDEFALIREIAKVSGRPVSVAVTQTRERPDAWRRVLDLIARARSEGLDIHAQITVRPVSILMGLVNRTHFLMTSATYREMASLPLEDQMRWLVRPETKAQILGDLDLAQMRSPMLYDWANFYRFRPQLPYLPDPEQSVAKVAQAKGVAPESVAYDWLIEGGGTQFLYSPLRNFAEGNQHVLREMIGSQHTIVGLGDAGAHCGVLCDASMPTFLLTYWRDQSNDAGFPLEFLVHELTQRAAQAWEFDDRGLIAVGKRADLNVIDLERLALRMPAYERDLPANGGRLIQRADGYVITLVKGVAVMTGGESTGKFPGRLIAAIH